ncbi:RNA-directed DNA polymerase, eukaryota, reverse transcriptase zinc-binding domain protein, partial [Tanacetum coccineum]
KTLLFTSYNRLYHLDQDKDCLIIDRINNGQWSWNWSRNNLGVRNLAYLRDMLNEIGQLNIDVNEDTCTWSLGPNGTFTVKDARYRIDQNIIPTLAHATTWDKSIPRKVNVFMWRLSLDRLPHRLNLSSRGMDIPAISCPSCNANVESANHVFFECDIATDMWKLVFRWCDIPLFQASSWDSFNDWIISWHASKEKKHRFYVITTSVLWWLWRYRNSVTFNSQPLRKSDLFDNVRFSSFSWLHNRDHMKLSWNDWLMYPLSITRNGNVKVSGFYALWVQVIKAYHGQEGGFDTNGCSFKGIWANIVGTSNFLHSKGIILSNTFRFKAGCGTRIRFWKDIWVGETPLFTRYNRLYHLDQDKDCLIIDRINNGQWSWNWSRTNLGVRNLAYLRDMLNEIGQLNIDVNKDTCTWSLGPNGTFTVKNTRYRIDQNILPTLAHATTWDKSIPRKVNVFMWRLSLDRLPHRLNLSSRGMDIPAISCPSCNANVESANHIFFECDIATDMWKLVFRWCDIPLFQASSWDSFNDWIISWHASKEKKHRFYVITTSVLWWLWRYRNSVTFNSQPLRKSDLFDNVRFSSFSWLHNRDHMKLSWNDWLMYPLSIARNGNG